MKIQYASDLHLEFRENAHYLKETPLEVTGDVLVLAGDIGYLGDDNYSKHPFWDWASSHYLQVIVVPGNHEFYKFYDLETMHNGWSLEIRPNVHCCYNCVIALAEDIDLIVSTLWSKIAMQDAYYTECCVSDFRRIMMGDATLSWARFNAEHERCFEFIKESVAKSKARHIIVATHHVPSFALMDPQYRGSNLNGAFTVELGYYIEESPIEYWIYGHSHRNIDAVIGHTQCVSNQLGYVSHQEHLAFDRGRFLEI